MTMPISPSGQIGAAQFRAPDVLFLTPPLPWSDWGGSVPRARGAVPDPLTPSPGQIGAAQFRAPEVLFRPDLIGAEYEGIHEVLMYSIQKSDLDLRKVLFQNIVLSGGSTLIKVCVT